MHAGDTKENGGVPADFLPVMVLYGNADTVGLRHGLRRPADPGGKWRLLAAGFRGSAPRRECCRGEFAL
ncbi:MAG: hypothetical protein EOS37_29780 [Mesorhizobium sp.]|nr:MAG: hypothetical protein EOS37_29780 [Mesorhizobium sp.]